MSFVGTGYLIEEETYGSEVVYVDGRYENDYNQSYVGIWDSGCCWTAAMVERPGKYFEGGA